MTTPRSNALAHAIAVLGAAIILFALYLHWRYEREIEFVVLGIGGFFLWYGGFMANRKQAIEGGTFVVDSLVKLGSLFRITIARSGGNRAEDKSPVPTVVLPASPTVPIPPVTTATVTEEHDE